MSTDVNGGSASSMSERIKMFGGTTTKPPNTAGRVSSVGSKFGQPNTDINANKTPTGSTSTKPGGWKPPVKPNVSTVNKPNIPESSQKTVVPKPWEKSTNSGQIPPKPWEKNRSSGQVVPKPWEKNTNSGQVTPKVLETTKQSGEIVQKSLDKTQNSGDSTPKSGETISTSETARASVTKSPISSSQSPRLDEGMSFNPKALLKPKASKGGVPQATFISSPKKELDISDGQKSDTKPPATTSSVLKSYQRTKVVVTRIDDGKKFVKLPKSAALTNDITPIKPLKLKNSDLKEIILEFQKAYDDFKNSNDELYDDLGNFMRPEEEEEYDDVDNVLRKSGTSDSIRPVSLIPDMSEHEEQESGGSVSGSGSGSASGGSWSALKPQRADPVFEVEGEFDETYEELPVNETDAKEIARLQKEEAEKLKKDEKEKKKQEKKEKARLEKERKEKEKQEKQLREMRKFFKITGDETKEAEGVVRAKAKGGRGGDLAVQADEHVDIIRMTDTPKGKWLVRNAEGTYGYVESENMSIETPLIKQAGGNV